MHPATPFFPAAADRPPDPSAPGAAALHLAIVGAGPVGLALALHAARALPGSQITLFDARPAELDVSGDPRTLALSYGSVQWLERLGVWPAAAAQPILEVHVSQQPPSGLPFAAWLPEALARGLDAPALRIRAADEDVPMLGAVLSYGQLVSSLQRAWAAAEAAEPRRLHGRFGEPVAALKKLDRGVEVDGVIAERFDLAVIAEGSASSAISADSARKAYTHDYRQTAWVGKVGFETAEVAAESGRAGRTPQAAARGVAYERFTRNGPAALLPLKEGGAGLVWCVPTGADPVADLSDAQRIAVLNDIFPREVGRIASITPLKRFPLGLSAERTLTDGRISRIGNAAQTLHPVAGQGLNLGLRDAFELVDALGRSDDIDAVLRRLERDRGPDRWAMIAATDFLARSFTWVLPGAGAARGLGIAALQALGPAKSLLARQMMYGRR